MKKSLFEGFHHVSINSNNYDEAYKFYSEILMLDSKIEFIHNDRRAVMFDCHGNNYIEIFEVDEPAIPGTQLAHFALSTIDCEYVLKKVREFGLEVTHEIEDIKIAGDSTKKARIAFFKGPSGELIELFETEDF